MRIAPKKIILSFFLLAVLMATIYSFLIEPNSLVVKKYELRVKRWSAKLNGLKIVAISDIHAGSNFIDEYKIQEIVAETNAQNPDLIVLLGDYVSPSFFDQQKLNMPLETIAENLQGLRAKYGVYGVLGNADEAFNREGVINAFNKVGIKILSNEVTTIQINDEKLRVLGKQDRMEFANWHDILEHLKIVLSKSENEGGLVVLAHNPDYLDVIAEDLSSSNNLHIILAGHTHGGQVWLPLIGSLIVPSEYGQKYLSGHIEDPNTDMFVTTGIGTSNIPVRFNVPPEISVLTVYAK